MRTTTAAKSKGVVPDFAKPAKEDEPFIRKFKEGLCKKWSTSTMNALFKLSDLAFYLTALGRLSEAEAVCAYMVKTVPYTGNFNLWTPVGESVSLDARLKRLQSKSDSRARAALRPILAHPFRVALPRAEASAKLKALPLALAEAFAGKSQKIACEDMARKLYSVCFYLEMALAKQPGYMWVQVPTLDAQWREWVNKLGERIRA